MTAVVELVLRNGEVARQRGSAERSEIDVHHDMMRDVRRAGDAPGRVDLYLMSLSVTERHRERLIAIPARDRERGRRVQSSTEEHHRPRHCSAWPRSSMRS